MATGVKDLAVAYQIWKNQVKTTVETVQNCSGSLNGSNNHIRCPNPAHKDQHPSFRITKDGAPVCTCQEKITWDELAAWVGATSWKEYKENIGVSSGVLTNYKRHSRRYTQPAIDPMPDTYGANESSWQEGASRFHSMSIAWLYDSKATYSLEYLEKRGITEGMCQAYEIGFNPTEYRNRWGTHEVWLPPGIVIPWFLGQYQTIRVRPISERYASVKKYHQPTGANNKGLYYGGSFAVNPILKKHVVILTEGEFDAMLIRFIGSQAYCRDELLYPVFGVATGALGNGHSVESVNALAIARHVLIAFDNETDSRKVASVDKYAKWWIDRLPNASRVVPIKHDLTDMWKAGDNLVKWLNEAMKVGVK